MPPPSGPPVFAFDAGGAMAAPGSAPGGKRKYVPFSVATARDDIREEEEVLASGSAPRSPSSDEGGPRPKRARSALSIRARLYSHAPETPSCVRRFALSEPSLARLVALLQALFRLDDGSFRLGYRDPDGEYIALGDQVEMPPLVDAARALAPSPLVVDVMHVAPLPRPALPPPGGT